MHLPGTPKAFQNFNRQGTNSQEHTLSGVDELISEQSLADTKLLQLLESTTKTPLTKHNDGFSPEYRYS